MKYELLMKNYNVSRSAAITSINKSMAEYGDISLGTDVEFLFYSKTKEGMYRFIPADSFLHYNGMVGTDGRSLIGEFRVTPAYDVRVLMKSIEKTFEVFGTKVYRFSEHQIDGYGMGAYKLMQYIEEIQQESIGTHIHFGYDFATGQIEKCVTILDAILVPIVKLFEPRLGHFIRSQCGYYGDLSDFRTKYYGFEYRTLPCFFDNKEVTAGIFALAKACVFEVITENINEEDISSLFSIQKGKIVDEKYLRIMIKKARLFVKKYLRFYHVYKKEIDTLFDMALSPNQKRFYTTLDGILKAWDISPDADDEFIQIINNIEVIYPRCVPIPFYEDNKYTKGLGVRKRQPSSLGFHELVEHVDDCEESI